MIKPQFDLARSSSHAVSAPVRIDGVEVDLARALSLDGYKADRIVEILRGAPRALERMSQGMPAEDAEKERTAYTRLMHFLNTQTSAQDFRSADALMLLRHFDYLVPDTSRDYDSALKELRRDPKVLLSSGKLYPKL